MGKFMFLLGIAGMVICIMLLILLPRIFDRQKKKLLHKINEE